MARAAQRFPTYEFAHDPLPPQTKRPKGQSDLRQPGFRPAATVRVGDTRVQQTIPVTGAVPWRQTGNTAFDPFLTAISRTHPPGGQSPLVPEARELYQVLHDAGLTRFAAAMLWHEKKNDTWQDTPIPAWMRNPFSTKDRSRPGEWERFDTYAAAARAWVERVSKVPYPQGGSIQEFVEIYAPASENDVARYVAVLEQEINALPLDGALPAPPKGKPITVAGLPSPVFVPSDFPFEVALTPLGPNRSGHAMVPQGVTQHETNNLNAGFGARGHARWQDDGTPGHPDGFIGVHFYVDDTVVIQKIPVNEVSIHAGSPPNETHISVELCTNSDRDVQRAERNAMMLAAALLRDGLQRGPESLKNHNEWWSENPCPRILRGENRWPAFKQTVADLIAEAQSPPPEFPGLPPTMPVEVFLSLFPLANPAGPVTKFYIDYCVNHLPPGQWPRFNGATDLSDGTKWWDFNPLHIYSNAAGKVWIADGAGPRTTGQPTAKPGTGVSQLPDLRTQAMPKPESALPARDFALKEVAVQHDRRRRRAVTTSETKLRSSPRGDVIRTLAAGTRLTILGRAEDGFLPVVVRGDDAARGYVRREDVSDRGDERDDDQVRGQGQGQGQGEGGEPSSPDRPLPVEGPDGSAPAGQSGKAIAAEASRYIGYPYVWATHGPSSFDCSGLVHWVVLQATGQAITADSHAQFNLGTPIDWDVLQLGDVLFYDTMGGQEVREGNSASHVGIFVGSGRMVNALNEERGVIESDPFSPYFQPLYLGARRLV